RGGSARPPLPRDVPGALRPRLRFLYGAGAVGAGRTPTATRWTTCWIDRAHVSRPRRPSLGRAAPGSRPRDRRRPRRAPSRQPNRGQRRLQVMSRSAMGVLGGHGQGGLLVWESTETLPEGGAHTTSVTERAGREDTDAGAARLEPEVVLPAQVLDRRATMLQPEKRLMLAVLEDATATLLRYPLPRQARKRRALREAEEWLD